ncbi:DUF6327 family protein [Flavobacterium sp.]|uniref:DUF6327 family protein n=1 Tax=Flavobacterium sp. TaxID=239 RepID=UPI0026294603|nr:DUF6327 family protein [Flavobacterium sp.]
MENMVYSSFEEIDRDLEILKLQKEIDYQKLSLSIEKTVDGLSPHSMIQNFLGGFGGAITQFGLLQKIVIPFLIKKFIK